MSGWYVVFKGKVPSIYFSWAECSEQVLHFKGNVHKYNLYEQALEAFNSTINSISLSQTSTSICISDNVVEPWGSRCLRFVGNVGMTATKWFCCGQLQKNRIDESLLV